MNASSQAINRKQGIRFPISLYSYLLRISRLWDEPLRKRLFEENLSRKETKFHGIRRKNDLNFIEISFLCLEIFSSLLFYIKIILESKSSSSLLNSNKNNNTTTTAAFAGNKSDRTAISEFKKCSLFVCNDSVQRMIHTNPASFTLFSLCYRCVLCWCCWCPILSHKLNTLILWFCIIERTAMFVFACSTMFCITVSKKKTKAVEESKSKSEIKEDRSLTEMSMTQ